jgi:integrase/recombinase XerC
MFQAFIQYLQFEKRCSEHTLIAYQTDLAQFQTYFEFKEISVLSELTSLGIRSWVVHLIDSGLTNRTVNRKVAALRTLFKWLRKDGIVDSNPMVKIHGPKNEKRLPVFAKESELESNKLAGLFTNDFDGMRDALMVELFYQTGIRLNELINLKETDISEQTIKVLGKRNKERVIPIPDLLVQFIRQYNELNTFSSDYLILTDKGEQAYPMFIQRLIKKQLGEISTSEKLSPHILRHSYATHLLNRGADLNAIKELLGHANLAATQVYTHNSMEKLKEIYKQAHPKA